MAKKEEKQELTREERIARMCDNINKGEHGGENKDAVTWLGSRKVITLERFPSGDQELDKALGGGWPRGRFVEVYGPESGGKSTICLHAIAEFQKKYPEEDVALIDTEYSFDEEYAIALGVNTRWLIVHQPDNGKQALSVLSQLIQQGVGLAVVDSVAALTTKSDMEGDTGDNQVAEQARMMSQALRRLTVEAGKRRTTVFFTNQMRELIGVTYGDKTTTPAGRALKHYASIRCGIRRSAMVKEMIEGEEVVVASETQVDVKKNKTAPPFRKAKFYIVYGRGIDPVISTLDAAIKCGVVEKRGSWLVMDGENLGQGRAKVIDLFHEDKDLFAQMADQVRAKMAVKVPVVDDDDDDAPPPVSALKKRPKGTGPEDDEAIDVKAVEVQDA